MNTPLPFDPPTPCDAFVFWDHAHLRCRRCGQWEFAHSLEARGFGCCPNHVGRPHGS